MLKNRRVRKRHLKGCFRRTRALINRHSDQGTKGRQQEVQKRNNFTGNGNKITFPLLLTRSKLHGFIFQGYTALHLAVMQGHENVIASLFDSGTKTPIVSWFLLHLNTRDYHKDPSIRPLPPPWGFIEYLQYT